MNIRHLRIFKTICEEGSITKASEKLYITQPAVSTAINELEQYLGICLFDRVARKLQLNETGKLFLSKTIQLLDLYDDLEQRAKELEEHATLKIGSSITIANYVLPQAIVAFERLCQNTPTKIVIDNAKNIELMVTKNEVDLGLIEGVVYNKELVSVPFSSYELVVVCSPQHVLAKESSVDINTLVKEKFLLREEGSAIRDVFDSALLLHGLHINPAWTSVNSQALIHAAKHNLGVSVLPRKKVEKELSEGTLVTLTVDNMEFVCVNHIVYHKDKHQTSSFKQLLNIIEASDSI